MDQHRASQRDGATPESSGSDAANVGLEAVAKAGRRATESGYARYAGVGVQYAATLGLFAWGGHALDSRFDTSPLLLIAGVLLGFVGGTLSLIRKVPPVSKRGNSGTKVANAAEPLGDERPPSA